MCDYKRKIFILESFMPLNNTKLNAYKVTKSVNWPTDDGIVPPNPLDDRFLGS